MARSSSDIRVDAYDKASGVGTFVAERDFPGLVHIAVARSPFARAEILSIDTTEAASIPGVIGFLQGRDVAELRYGRSARDIPLLAQCEVRFAGEPVVAVIAESRLAAEKAAEAVYVDYREMVPLVDPLAATDETSSLVHDAPWEYDAADESAREGRNIQSIVRFGDRDETRAAIEASPYVLSQVYTTQAVHQGYLEPHACVASVDENGVIDVWATNKSPYYLRAQLAACFGISPNNIVVHPGLLGGDFGGKGSPMSAPVCIEVARRFGRPAKIVLRYNEELIAGNPRHPATIRVTLGADEDGVLTGAMLEGVLDGGAYVGFKHRPSTVGHGVPTAFGAYDLPQSFGEITTVYTNSIPKGHMRQPGGVQGTFAVESAMDELALLIGIDPIDLRLRNLLALDPGVSSGATRVLRRVRELREGQVSSVQELDFPDSWRIGRGISLLTRHNHFTQASVLDMTQTTLRLKQMADGVVEVETTTPETGTGSHTVLRNLLAEELGIDRSLVRIISVSTSDLLHGVPASGSLVTATLVGAAKAAGEAWRAKGAAHEVLAEYRPSGIVPNEEETNSCVQDAVVAVDVESGEVRVLELISVIEVGRIINEKAHQMQIDGGSIMGFGYAVMEDLCIEDGYVGSAHLGEFRLPTVQDVPHLTTHLLKAEGPAKDRIIEIGESTNVIAAPAIANAVYNAVGVRVRSLPINSEVVYQQLTEKAEQLLTTVI